MSQLIHLVRAARLVGVTRAALQKKVQAGELAAFDGMIATEELLRVFPEARLDVDGAFERVTEIKERAFGKRVRERTLPSQELLAERLFEHARELADTRAHLQNYHRLVVDLGSRIRAMAEQGDEALRPAMRELAEVLDRGLAAILGEGGSPDAIQIMDEMLSVVSAHVVLRPSGHEYFVQGADTILEGALKAGLALNYGCSSGTCGLCKLRVASGQVRRTRPHDYVLSEAEKQAGYTLACSYAPVSDLVLEALEAGGPQDIPEQNISARVRAIERASPDLVLLHLQTPRSNRLRFFAGQSVVLGFHPAGSAEFPIASCPCDDRNLHFHIPRDPDSSFAEHVFAGVLGRGDTVSVWGPTGDFVLREESARRIAFVACDTGFAPVKSLVEHALALENAERIGLYRLATRADGHYLGNLCRAWCEALDEFLYRPIDGTGQPVQEQAEAILRAIAQDFPEAAALHVFVAAPEALAGEIGRGMAARGLPATQFASTIIDR
ncbi:MAG: hypothetical protein Fur0039_17250 [Rhodocyclaceae bacterium]